MSTKINERNSTNKQWKELKSHFEYKTESSRSTIWRTLTLEETGTYNQAVANESQSMLKCVKVLGQALIGVEESFEVQYKNWKKLWCKLLK